MQIAVRLPGIRARQGGSLNGPFMVLMKEIGMAHALSPFLVGALMKDLGGRWAVDIMG